MNTRAISAAAFAFLAGATVAEAKDDSFAIIFNNTKNDGGYNESALRGLERFKAETGQVAREIVTRTEDEAIRALGNFAANGVKNIVAISFNAENAVRTVAQKYPNVHFTLIDGTVDLPNVRSVLFREDEAAYLAGVAAALSTKSGKVGYVGGIPIPPVRRYECGFIQGVKSVRKDIEVIRDYLDRNPANFNVFRDKTLGEKVGAGVLAKGADVVFAAAGFGGNGALEAAAKANALGIGVDVNQNGLFPGKILTSAVKRVDVAVFNAYKDGLDGTWTPGVQVLGTAGQGVDWARDANNEALVKPFADTIEAAAKGLGSGAVKVTDYETTDACL